MLHVIKMVQVSNFRWHMVSPKGHVMFDDLLMASPYAAEEWIKKYISSFNCWSYVIIPLKEQP